MSNKFRKHYADVKGSIMEEPGIGILMARGAGAPTNGVAGYAPGCLYQNTSGTAGSVLYTNQGTATSATWLNIA